MTYSNRYITLFLAILAMGMNTIVGMEPEEPVSSYRQFVEDIGFGSTAGGTEVAVEGQFLTAAKNILQRIEGKSVRDRLAQFVKIITEDPKILVRGSGVNLACMIPTTAAQIATNNGLKKLLPGDDLPTSIGCAYASGALSAGFICIPEMIALHQQIGKQSAYQAYKQLTAHKGFLESIVTIYRGLGPKMHRDGPFGAALLAGYPWMKAYLKKYTNDDRVAMVGAGATVGSGIAVATHPFDRVSTFMQVDYKKERAKTMWDAFKIIYEQKGLGGFYAGVVPRALRAGFAVPIIYTTQEKLRNKMHTKSSL